MTERGSPHAAGVREGDILAGKYRVERVLGMGGMGVVVAAHHIQLDEKVALKFLLPEALGDSEAVARFAREARNAVKIKSEHVARVTDVGTLPNGAPYMVMEYLEGGDLAAWIKQRGALPIEQALEFVLQACIAVAEAHALGIVHRDLKPANLFCVRRSDEQLSIKVLDFGISKSASDGRVVAPSCTLPLVACGAQCVNLAASGSNCGACNRGCGNGENNCSKGLCTPVTVMTDAPIVGLGVDNGNVFVHFEYDGGAGGIDECAVTGCAPLKHVVASSNDPRNYEPRITASGGIIGIQSAMGNESLDTCLESSCTFSGFSSGDLDTWVTAGNVIAQAIIGSRANYVTVAQVALDGGATYRWGNGMPGGLGSQASAPLAIDGTNFVFSGYMTDAGTGLVSCTVASNCADPVIVTTTVPGIVDVYGGTIFLTTPGVGGSAGGFVTTCPAGAACPTPANFVNNIYPLTIVETSVDASGYYWLNSQGSIWTCKQSGCNKSGIPVTNAGTDPAASMFALYDGFVYFAGTGSNAATVYRIAEPAP